jgi:hypothetical protein
LVSNKGCVLKIIKCVASYDAHSVGVAEWIAYDENNDIVGSGPILTPLQEKLEDQFDGVEFLVDWNM